MPINDIKVSVKNFPTKKTEAQIDLLLNSNKILKNKTYQSYTNSSK
jgi:hypothetical protein